MADSSSEVIVFDSAATMGIDANTAKRATSRKETAVARSRYQNGSLSTRGKRPGGGILDPNGLKTGNPRGSGQIN
jgi:hypothetical protein